MSGTLARRLEDLEKRLKKRIGHGLTAEQVRDEVQFEVASVKFSEIVEVWGKEYEQILSGIDVDDVYEAFDVLLTRVKTESILTLAAWGNMFIPIITVLRGSEISRMEGELRGIPGWVTDYRTIEAMENRLQKKRDLEGWTGGKLDRR